ncbi:MAG: carboxypeptidase-like regulatory domain-containing protein [Bacteroidales bacterium]|nr:carboxypeptidase-like regulatory domain-containing protein [Bacteroidales bacterium]
MKRRHNTLLSQPQAAASSPNLGEQPDRHDGGSSSSPKLGGGCPKGRRRSVKNIGQIMNKGKDICKELKAVRKQIAAENGIPLDIPECTYKGPCRGTCPRCESEVRFLENELAKRIKLGKVATVAGIALALAAPGVAEAQSGETPAVPPSHERQVGECEVTGVVVDGKRGEPIPYARVMLLNGGDTAKVTVTDFDGRYRFNVLAGHYTMVVNYVGYKQFRREVDVKGYGAEQAEATLEAAAVVMDTARLENSFTGLVQVVFETKGTLLDERTKEPLPFVNVIVKQDGQAVAGATTDFDGNFALELPEGKYDFEISSLGYERMTFPVRVPDDTPLKAIELKSTARHLEGIVVIDPDKVPLMEIGSPGTVQGTEIDGVQVRVQY